MTREECIKVLQALWRYKDCGYSENEIRESLDIAIKALEQEPCEDAVSRKKLDKALYEYFHEEDSPNNITDVHLGAVRNFIKNFPSVNPQEPRWIPVSERLPNKNQWVLVTTEDYQKLVEIMCYQGIRIGQRDVGNGWEEYKYPSWTSGHGDIQGSHPKAWMPLPKPYREVEE